MVHITPYVQTPQPERQSSATPFFSLPAPRRAVARFLFLNITFETSLLIEEDDQARTIKFKNEKEGFMKKVKSYTSNIYIFANRCILITSIKPGPLYE